MDTLQVAKRANYFHDFDGVVTLVADPSEIISHSFNLDPILGGATILSVSWTTKGPALSSQSNTANVIGVKSTGSGRIEALATFSDGQKALVVFNIQPLAKGQDYA